MQLTFKVYLLISLLLLVSLQALQAAPHHRLEEALLSGNWRLLRAQADTTSNDPIAKFLVEISKDFTGERSNQDAFTAIASDTTGARKLGEWIVQLLQQESENIHAVFAGGCYEMMAGAYESAVSLLSDVISRDPGLQPAYAVRGSAYLMLDHPELGIADFTIAIQLDSADYTSFVNRANSYLYSKDYEHALADFDQAIALKPNTARILYNRGNANAEYNRDSAAIADYTLAIECDSTLADAYFNRANGHNRRGDFDRALKDYYNFLRVCPESRVQSRKQAVTEIGRIKLLLRKMTVPGKRAAELISEGAALSQRGKATEALQKFEEAYHTDSLVISSSILAATLWTVMGERDSAIAWSENAILVDSLDADGWEMRGYSRLINRQGEFSLIDSTWSDSERMAMYHASQVDFSKAIALQPEIQLSYYYRSQIYLASGDTTSALKDLERFLLVAGRTQKELIQKAQVQLRTLRPEQD